jgi:cytochrome c biogenesis factor
MELLESGVALFSGTISTAFNGGFAMTRLPLNVKLDADTSKVILTVKGDGKKYQLRIKSKKYQRYWYVQSFETSKGLQEIELPLKEFYASFRGYRLNAPAFSSSQLREMAILIGNKKNESFALEVHKIIIE